MQKIYAEVYADIKHKKDIRRVLSDGYELVQEGALYLCEHYGRRLNDVIGYNKKGKAKGKILWGKENLLRNIFVKILRTKYIKAYTTVGQSIGQVRKRAKELGISGI